MDNYKLYHVEAGRFSRCESIQAENDQEAVRWAEDRIGAVAAELWCDDRKVAIFRPQEDSSP